MTGQQEQAPLLGCLRQRQWVEGKGWVWVGFRDQALLDRHVTQLLHRALRLQQGRT